MIEKPMTKTLQALLAIVSFFIVAFGQPAWFWWSGLLASCIGYALFWRVILDYPSKKSRFWISSAWFFAVQLVQLSWMPSHPFNYIYIIYFGMSAILAAQFGFLGIFIKRETISKISGLIALASLWTLLEWSRLFILSGFSFNPSGIALSGSIYSMQIASLWGVFGMSFWVCFVNMLALRAWLTYPAKFAMCTWALAALLPYLFGTVHFHTHSKEFDNSNSQSGYINAVLVQTAFPAEEAIPFKDKASYIAFVISEWRQVLRIVRQHKGKDIDLIALPEYVVPFGTYTYLYPYDTVKSSFEEILGPDAVDKLPPKEEPFAKVIQTSQGKTWFVNNAFWVQGIANVFNAEVISGLEDAEDIAENTREYYSSAIHFKPHATQETFNPTRYAKRVLLPMAEYIPLSSFPPCKTLAARYGIQGSFTCGQEATVFAGCKGPFGASICYEETFGDLTRESRQNGAEMLVNLTSDVWYPNSRLPQQHFDHARLRTVESGFPLLRSCNTGITCAFDSLGRVVGRLGEDPSEYEWIADSLYVQVPRYHYQTLYTKVGDSLIIGFSALMVILFFCGSLFARLRK